MYSVIDGDATRLLKPVRDKPNHSLNEVDPLCPIFLEYVRRGVFCWLHCALLPHSGPLNWILPDIEFSFEHRGSKTSPSSLSLSLFFPPSRSGLTSKQAKEREQADACLIAQRLGHLVLKMGFSFFLINSARTDTNIFKIPKSAKRIHNVDFRLFPTKYWKTLMSLKSVRVSCLRL